MAQTPAQKIEQAISLLSAAYDDMVSIGVRLPSVLYFYNAIESLRRENDDLPALIWNIEEQRCPDCVHGKKITPTAAEPAGIECQIIDPYDCPAVRACGFLREGEKVPEYLKIQRQGE